MRAEDILAGYSHNSLRTIARTRDYPFGTLRRPELIPALAEQLFVPDALRGAVSRLHERERAVLTLVVEHGGRMPVATLVERLLSRGLIDEPGPSRPRETIDRIAPTTRQFDELCARLTAQGLLFSEPPAEGTLAGHQDLRPGAVVFVPGAISEILRQHVGASNPDAAPSVSDTATAEPAGGRLVVQPSYTVLLLPPLDEPTLAWLRNVAEPVQIAEVAEFRLTQDALYTATQRGTAVAAVLAFLEARSERPVPQNVRFTLEGWARAFEQVTMFRGAMLADAPAPVLDHLLEQPELASLVLRRLSPTRVVFADAASAERALAACGELLAVTDYASNTQALLDVAADGTIAPRAGMDHLLLPLALRRIAAERADGRWELRPELVRAEVANTPDGLTGLLKWLRAHASELPPELVARVKLWALPPDAVSLEQPLLLHMPADLLADLRAIPELAPLLNEEYRPAAALVRVAPEQRSQLIAALERRGLVIAAPAAGSASSEDHTVEDN